MITKFGQLVDLLERSPEYNLSQVLFTMRSQCAHAVTCGHNAITMRSQYFLTKTHIPTSIWGGGGERFEGFFQLVFTPCKAKQLLSGTHLLKKRRKTKKARKETAYKDIFITSRNGDRKIVEPVQIMSRHSARVRKWNNFSQLK